MLCNHRRPHQRESEASGARVQKITKHLEGCPTVRDTMDATAVITANDEIQPHMATFMMTAGITVLTHGVTHVLNATKTIQSITSTEKQLHEPQCRDSKDMIQDQFRL